MVVKMTNYTAETYYSYNDLNRPAMFLGVPIIASLVLSILILVLSVIFFLLFKLIGLLIILFVGVVVFFICRVICENDPNGLYNKKYFLLGLFFRLRVGQKVITLSSSNIGYK